MIIEATGEYTAKENGVTVGSFNKLEDGYVFISVNRIYAEDELQEILDKLTELNSQGDAA